MKNKRDRNHDELLSKGSVKISNTKKSNVDEKCETLEYESTNFVMEERGEAISRDTLSR